jgi:hypothetical protein
VWGNFSAVRYLCQKKALDPYGDELDPLLSGNNDLTASTLQSRIFGDLLVGGWTQDAPFSLKRLVGLPVSDRPRDFVDCLFGYASLFQLAGFKGLVITIDEFEVEHLWAAQFERIIALVRHLAERLASGQGSRCPLAVFIATVGEEDHLGDALVDKIVKASGGGRRVLRAWSEGDREKLGQALTTLYGSAYDKTPLVDKRLTDRVEATLDQADLALSGSIRAFVKRLMAELDSKYGPPQEN